MAWTSSNQALSGKVMDDNAREFAAFFLQQGFTLNAIAAMLGNSWRESTINPGVWQNYKINYNLGFGLLQWSPATKVINWCEQNGLDPNAGTSQCMRVMWEKANGVQYYKTTAYPLTFAQFAQSTESPEYLCRAFFANYERGNPDKADMPGRIKWANYYYQLLKGETPSVPDPPPYDPENPKLPETSEGKKFSIMTRRKKWQR